MTKSNIFVCLDCDAAQILFKFCHILCLGCLLARQQGHDPRDFVHGYVQPGHPVMREVSAALQAVTGVDLNKAPQGTDGCSIPTFGLDRKSTRLNSSH